MKTNIFSIPDKPNKDEFFEILFKDNNIKIERIVSYGIPSPDGFWYEQEEFEWLTLIEGDAVIKYFDSSEVSLVKGDVPYIPPMVKHRVERVSNPCIWITVQGCD